MSETIQAAVGALLEKAIAQIRQNIDTTGERASGKTQASLRQLVTVEGNTVTGTIFGRQAFGTLEHGRRGGKVPRNFAAIIRQWIVDKGLPVTPIPYVRQPSERWQPKYTPEERGLMDMAWAIAEKIKRDGTSLYRRGGRADVYTPPLAALEKSLEDTLGVIFGIEIDNVLSKWKSK